MIQPSGFCHKCGLPLKDYGSDNPKELFCSQKHKELWGRQQERGIMKGKRASYGAKGNMS